LADEEKDGGGGAEAVDFALGGFEVDAGAADEVDVEDACVAGGLTAVAAAGMFDEDAGTGKGRADLDSALDNRDEGVDDAALALDSGDGTDSRGRLSEGLK